MSPQQMMVSAGLVALVALLVRGKMPPALAFGGTTLSFLALDFISLTDALRQFVNPGLLTVVLLILVSVVLDKSRLLARATENLVRGSYRLALLRLTAATSLFSAFLNNTAVVATLIGPLCANRTHAASRLLLPMCYAASLGGILTLVGTSTNLLVNSFMIGHGIAPLRMFDLLPVGLPIVVTCTFVMVCTLPILFPPAGVTTSPAPSGPTSNAATSSAAPGARSSTQSAAGAVDWPAGVELAALAVSVGDARLPVRTGEPPLALDMARSPVAGPARRPHPLQWIAFATAAYRQTGRVDPAHHGWLPMLGFLLVIALSALGAVNLLAGLMVLLTLYLAFGFTSLAELRRRLPLGLIVIMGCALTISQVMLNSGTATLIAGGMLAVFAPLGPTGALASILLLAWLLTELMTNNAAAALVFPVALGLAQSLGLEPLPFVMAVIYGASASFLTPYGYQTNLMVMAPGRYTLRDYLRAGFPVALAYIGTAMIAIPLAFPLR